MDVRIIENMQEWDAFVQQQPYTLFLQSSTYIPCAETDTEMARIVGVYDGGKLIGGSLIIGIRAKRGDYIVLPYGPILDHKNTEALRALFAYLKTLARQEKYSFIRVSPFEPDTAEIRKTYTALGCKKAPMHVLAEHTWMLDIKKDESVLLKAMKKNHRNLIRRCEREGVAVSLRKDPEALERLNNMHDEVAKRHNFHRFSRAFITAEMETLQKHDQALIFEATLPDGRVDASAMIVFYGNMAAYRHSASLNLDKRFPSSYLIQWSAIQEARKRGLAWYNFWGIAPKDATKDHPFYGITHFKTGFGGEQIDLLPCQDLPVSPKYYITRLFETLRRIRRGFS